MNPPRPTAKVLAGANAVLLDFDGPVCAVFASLPDWSVATRLRRVLARHLAAAAELPDWLAREHDPLEVLRFAGDAGGRDLAGAVDDELRLAERDAVAGAEPTPYARDVLVAVRDAGRKLAIVSNNSEQAVLAYLAEHQLAGYVDHVVGRPHGEPDLMKPNPHPVYEALNALGADPAASVLVGDSVTDIEAGRAARTWTIGYANRPGKKQRLLAAGADAVVEGKDGMGQLARALAAEVPWAR